MYASAALIVATAVVVTLSFLAFGYVVYRFLMG